MHQQLPSRSTQSWKDRFLRSGYFLGALFLHLVVFLLIATIVIWKAPEPPHDNEFKGVAVKVPPPPPQLPSAGDAARNPQFEPEQVVVPVATPSSVISSVSVNSSFAVDTSKALSQALTHVSDKMAQGAGLSNGAGNTGTGAGTGLFGSFSGNPNFLQGTVYDLKIRPDHSPTGMDQPTYTGLLHSFVVKGWDESVLSPFYKASKKLFTPAIWIATTPSEDCAKEMHLDNELSSTYWVGWYHAKITPSQAGSYHFVGFGDDILLVAVNGQTVLDGSLWPVTPAKQKMPWPYADWNVICSFKDQDYGKLRVGDSFQVNTLEPVTIDVLMGDEPGGFYNAFLMIADDSKQYPVGPEGVPLYPIFQIGSDPIHRTGDQPPHSSTPESWASP